YLCVKCPTAPSEGEALESLNYLDLDFTHWPTVKGKQIKIPTGSFNDNLTRVKNEDGSRSMDGTEQDSGELVRKRKMNNKKKKVPGRKLQETKSNDIRPYI